MTSKRPLSPAYAKRLASALARGKTRQQARGHQAREHVHRAEREREEHGTTTAEDNAIHAWCERYPNVTRDVSDVIQMARDKGYAWFQNYRSVWNSARRLYIAENKAGTYSSRGMGYLQMLADMADVDDISWVYYH